MTNEEVVEEHIRALLSGDRDALIDGYADDAATFVGANVFTGREAIRAMFDSVPDGALPNEVTIDSVVSCGEYLFTLYHHGDGMSGGDTFHVRDDKIVMQSAHVVNMPRDVAEHAPS